MTTPADITRAQKILAAIISYAKQPSTYRGLIAIAGAAGWGWINPETYNATMAGMVMVYGAINFFRNEDKRKLKLTAEDIEAAGEAMLRAYYRAKRGAKNGPDRDR